MRTPLIGLFCAVSLLLPASAWACVETKDVTFIVCLMGLGVVAMALISTAVIRELLQGWQRRNAVTLNLPRFWFLRMWSLGVVGYPLAIFMIAGIVSINYNALSEPAMVTLLLTTPLVLQAAYGARSWHRGLPRD